MLLLDTSFLIEFKDEVAKDRPAAASALLQTSLSRRLGENDAWIAATAMTYGATLVGRERAFTRVPRLDYLAF